MIMNPTLPLPLLLLATLALTATFLWLEWRRRAKFPALRITSVFIMMSALLGICIQPGYYTTALSKTLLLTKGYRRSVVDSLIKSDPSLTLRHVEGVQPHKNSKVWNFNAAPGDQNPMPGVIAGEGFPTYAIEQLTDHYDYYPAEPVAGVMSVSLPRTMHKNVRYTISGSYFNIKGQKLHLQSPAGKEDSISLTPGKQPFQLSFTPRVTGKVLFKLTTSDSTGESTSEILPLDIEEHEPLNILIVAGYPTFEIQYLKSFLQERNHRLSIRYQISKQLYRYEYLNVRFSRIDRLTKSKLDQFDLLVTDSESLSKLPVSERAAVTGAVSEGLGLLTLMTTSPVKHIQSDFYPLPLRKVLKDTTEVRVGHANYRFPVAQFRFIPDASLEPTLVNETGVLAGYTYSNRGKIAFQLLQETYRLMLSGDSIGYGLVWSPLLERTARQKTQSSSVSLSRSFPLFVDEPFEVDVVSSGKATDLVTDEIEVPLAEDPMLDDLWTTTVWAGKTGWHTLSTTEGDSLSYYVFTSQEWSALKSNKQVEDNLLYSRSTAGDQRIANTRLEAFSPLWFYVAFILSAGFLWLAPKL